MSDKPEGPKAEQQGPDPQPKPAQTTLDPALAEIAQTASEKGISIKEYLRREAQAQAQSIASTEVRKALGGFQQAQDKVNSFGQTLELLKESGALKEDANIEALKQAYSTQALTSAFAPPEEPTTEEKPPTEEPQQLNQANPALAEGDRRARELGLAEGDPELSMIVTDQGYAKWFETIEKAGAAKKERVGRQEGMPMDTGSGQSSELNPIKDISDPDTLLEKGLYG